MSQWKIAYPKDMLAEAKNRSKWVFSYGMRQPIDGGRYEAQTYMTEEDTTVFWLTVQEYIHQNGKMTIEEALAHARADVEKMKEARDKRLAAKADGPAGGGL